jgi:hypothetical protein
MYLFEFLCIVIGFLSSEKNKTIDNYPHPPLLTTLVCLLAAIRSRELDPRLRRPLPLRLRPTLELRYFSGLIVLSLSNSRFFFRTRFVCCDFRKIQRKEMEVGKKGIKEGREVYC